MICLTNHRLQLMKKMGVGMKCISRYLLCILLFGIFPTALLLSEGKAPWLWIGPRVGLTGVAASPEDFDSLIQEIYSSERQYFPLYSRIGLSVEQRIPLEQSKSYLSVQELIFVGGLDQTVALPFISLLINFHAALGLEAGLGPEFSLKSENGGPVLSPALVYALGWTFTFGKISLPVTFSSVPISPDGKPTFTLTAGLDFGLKFEPKEKEALPFNY